MDLALYNCFFITIIINVCFQMTEKSFGLRPLVFLIFKYFTEKLLLSQKLCYSQCFTPDQHLSIARYRVSFYANNYSEQLPILSSTFNTATSLNKREALKFNC